jgi:tetratricopeptide (TPR) repeat protein
LSEYPDAPPLFDVVESLLDQSLIHIADDGQPDRATRLSVYEYLRSFALEKLEECKAHDATARRHRGYYLSWAENLIGRYGDLPDASATAALADESDNLEGIVERDAEVAPDAAIRAALVLDPVFFLRGPLERTVHIMNRAVRCAENSAPKWRRRILAARGRAHSRRFRLDAAAADLVQAHDEAQVESDFVVLSKAALDLGIVSAERGEMDEAGRYFEDSLAAARKSGIVVLEGEALTCLAAWLGRGGQFARAEECHQRALNIHRDRANVRGMIATMSGLGEISFQTGRLSDAQRYFTDGVALAGDNGARALSAILRVKKCYILLLQERLDEVRDLIDPALDDCRTLGSSHATGGGCRSGALSRASDGAHPSDRLRSSRGAHDFADGRGPYSRF